MKLINHSLGIRPVSLVKLPVTLYGPMEEINNDLIYLDALSLVFTGNLKNLILSPVTKLALPESHKIFREHIRTSGSFGVIFK